MTSTYRSDHAADPELFERLMRERYGPLPKLLDERNRPRPERRARRALRNPAVPPNPDPHGAEHFAQLQAGIEEAAIGRPRPTVATEPKRTPPFPGATWCNSCDSWCTPLGVCRCNDR